MSISTDFWLLLDIDLRGLDGAEVEAGTSKGWGCGSRGWGVIEGIGGKKGALGGHGGEDVSKNS